MRRLRVARPTSTGEEREVLAQLVRDETGEAEEESGFVADAILAAFDVRLKSAHIPTDDEFAPGECDGSSACSAARHVHGCYTRHRADQCDSPDEYGHLTSEPQGRPRPCIAPGHSGCQQRVVDGEWWTIHHPQSRSTKE